MIESYTMGMVSHQTADPRGVRLLRTTHKDRKATRAWLTLAGLPLKVLNNANCGACLVWGPAPQPRATAPRAHAATATMEDGTVRVKYVGRVPRHYRPLMRQGLPVGDARLEAEGHVAWVTRQEPCPGVGAQVVLTVEYVPVGKP